MFSYRKAGQAGNVTRLMSCTAADLAAWRDDGVATHVAPSWSVHPRTGDQYSCALPARGVLHAPIARALAARQWLLTWRLRAAPVGP